MRIEKIKVKNYRQFKDMGISFSDKLTVLAGANNSEKASLWIGYTKLDKKIKVM